jgi:hypothetical protein
MPTPKKKASTQADVNQAPTGEKPENETNEMPNSATEHDSKGSKSREERIREAAYRRFESRGSSHGRHEQDWLDAESEEAPSHGN